MKPYVKLINKNAIDSHQTSPSWVVAFTRFNTRDTFNYKELGPKKLEPVRNPLVVENDCISISIETSKTNHTPKASLTLLSGDLNYATAVAPGDFFTVNIVNSPEKAREIRVKAGNKQPINKPGYGFKGVFKVNTVNKIVSVEPMSGQKILRYQITGYAFTEFNNIIYYNPTLPLKALEALLLSINLDIQEVIGDKENIQKVLELLPNVFLGGGKIAPSGALITAKKNPYIIPKDLFQLLGLDGKFAIDMYRIMIGIWSSFSDKTNFAKGMNPKTKENKQIQTLTLSLKGRIPVQTVSLVNITSMEIIKRFSNPLINEMYACFRVDANTGLILTKLVIRQKPFNSNHFEQFLANKTEFKTSIVEHTKFLELPRWKMDSNMIYNLNFSKNESLRFNFVHIIGSTGNSNLDGSLQSFSNADGSNCIFDEIDIQRHGMRPYTQISNFDWIDDKNKKGYSPEWAALCFDWVYGGHLKLNGTMNCVGIEDDVCIGDNLELYNTVFHIESIQHIAGITPDGKKMFRTNLSLTNGIDKRSSTEGAVYPEMDFVDTLKDRKDDYDFGEQILPGFSDTQDILGRKKGEEKKETINKSYTPKNIKQKE